MADEIRLAADVHEEEDAEAALAAAADAAAAQVAAHRARLPLHQT